ncbi:TetR/AcrR family transcriptional regulator [Terrarubrum flagellatum]|uniref:TetR/AcrR family transcriptional regulator n=1 Tax=Terrirubrum flagellatum TaxID=2895980 RepID=UPI00314522C5
MQKAGGAKVRRRSAQSHEAVLTAAGELAGRRGYAACTIEEIAAAAGVGKQTIYRWWPNKVALFIEVYCKLIPTNLGSKDAGSLEGDLECLLDELSRLYARTPAANILSGLVAEAQADASLAQQLRETYVAPRRVILRAVFLRAFERGEISSRDNFEFVSDLFSGAVWFRLLLGEKRFGAEFKRRLVSAIVSAIRLPPPRK